MRLIKFIWKCWKALADWVLKQAFHLILLVFYFTILVPFALVFQIIDQESFSPGWKTSPISKAEDLY